MHATLSLLVETDFPALNRAVLETVQVNIGYRCNQSCVHCHVNAGPTRTEAMSEETITQVLDYLSASGAMTLDITGGAPELHPGFKDMVSRARALGVHVIDRCNLTVLEEPGQEDTAMFLAANEIEIVASLPCYLEENVNAQRGDGVFKTSIRVLRQLNALGYGQADSGLEINLVYNPQGPTLPPDQRQLEADYHRILKQEHGVLFNHLFALCNMPIKRFGSTLISKGQFESYMDLLRGAHSDANLDGVMCRSLISVDWQGYVYDCDFNQMLDLPLSLGASSRTHIGDLMAIDLQGRPIAIADHCYGCTAGQGSSCGGALG